MGIASLTYIGRALSEGRWYMATEKVVEAKGGGRTLTLEQLRGRLNAYQSEIRQYLDSHEARVDTYRFAVEKDGEGYAVDVAIKASIHPKQAGISK